MSDTYPLVEPALVPDPLYTVIENFGVTDEGVMVDDQQIVFHLPGKKGCHVLKVNNGELEAVISGINTTIAYFLGVLRPNDNETSDKSIPPCANEKQVPEKTSAVSHRPPINEDDIPPF